MWLLQLRKVNGIFSNQPRENILLTVYGTAAKHLEPLKGGNIPLEIIVTTKDPEQKKKAFDKCLATIKSAGVWTSYPKLSTTRSLTQVGGKEKGRHVTQSPVYWSFRR